MAGELDLCHAYRKLYRAGLRAVQFSKPARYAVRERLRSAFRSPGGTFDQQRIRRTVWFLNAATVERGLEHSILKNILKVQRVRRVVEKPMPYRQMVATDPATAGKAIKRDAQDVFKKSAYVGYDRTVAMLNDSMGLCL